jgi:hypothetical protein
VKFNIWTPSLQHRLAHVDRTSIDPGSGQCDACAPGTSTRLTLQALSPLQKCRAYRVSMAILFTSRSYRISQVHTTLGITSHVSSPLMGEGWKILSDEKTQRNSCALWGLRPHDPTVSSKSDLAHLLQVCAFSRNMKSKDHASWMDHGYWPAIVRFSWLFSVPTGKFWYSTLKQATVAPSRNLLKQPIESHSMLNNHSGRYTVIKSPDKQIQGKEVQIARH